MVTDPPRANYNRSKINPLGNHNFARQNFLTNKAIFKSSTNFEMLLMPKTAKIGSTLRSWHHQISTRIKICPLDWRTTIHWNVVLAIFQHNDICQDCWKNTISTCTCMVILESRGQVPKLRDKSVPYFQQESGPCPLDWRITIHSNVDLVFFQQSWHIWLCWKIARTIF